MYQLLAPTGRLHILEPNFECAIGCRYPGLTYHKPRRLLCSGDPIRVTLGTMTLWDIYRRHQDYRDLLGAVGFEVVSLTEPVPDESVGVELNVARLYPPYLIITARSGE